MSSGHIKLFAQHSIDSELACACQRRSSCECGWNDAGTLENVGEDSIIISPSLHIKLTLSTQAQTLLLLLKIKTTGSLCTMQLPEAYMRQVLVSLRQTEKPRSSAIQWHDFIPSCMLAGSNDGAAAAFDLLLTCWSESFHWRNSSRWRRWRRKE